MASLFNAEEGLNGFFNFPWDFTHFMFPEMFPDLFLLLFSDLKRERYPKPTNIISSSYWKIPMTECLQASHQYIQEKISKTQKESIKRLVTFNLCVEASLKRIFFQKILGIIKITSDHHQKKFYNEKNNCAVSFIIQKLLGQNSENRLVFNKI